ncbi:MAG TPA: class I SAM-dependent methyltransferase [Candidatus Hydrogenedentes bacterium]|nr:class I SAM-dependent methyltransferase [Candidatus Hydrogenedentota bacterium]HIJ73257.1 class I SAM-dependent methyltransferase [Candidatus Hydrogenedentota bacterium]
MMGGAGDINPAEPFERIAAKYDALVASPTGFPYEGYNEVLDQVVRRAEANAGMTILDMGVGTGNLAQRLHTLGCKIWGIDFSPAMLREAEPKLPGAVLLQADIAGEWPSAVQRRFDRVVSSYALHHFDLRAKRDLLQRVAGRFLEQDGRIVVADISFPTVIARQEARERVGASWDDDEHYWAVDETTDALAEVGLRVDYSQVSAYSGVFSIERT